jgi:hypothetical protein
MVLEEGPRTGQVLVGIYRCPTISRRFLAIFLLLYRQYAYLGDHIFTEQRLVLTLISGSVFISWRRILVSTATPFKPVLFPPFLTLTVPNLDTETLKHHYTCHGD